MRKRTLVLAAWLGIVGGALACGSFGSEETSPTPASDSGTSDALAQDGSSDASGDAPEPDAGEEDSGPPPIWRCPNPNAAVIVSTGFSTPAGVEDLTGWTSNQLNGGVIGPVAVDGGIVVRAAVGDVSGETYATLQRPISTSHYAAELTFSMSTPESAYVVHQGLADANLTVFVSGTQIKMGTVVQNTIIGAAGGAGAVHKLAYRVEVTTSGVTDVHVSFDGQPSMFTVPAVLSYDSFQIGPFWPLMSKAPALQVDYDDVTIWDCTK